MVANSTARRSLGQLLYPASRATMNCAAESFIPWRVMVSMAEVLWFGRVRWTRTAAAVLPRSRSFLRSFARCFDCSKLIDMRSPFIIRASANPGKEDRDNSLSYLSLSSRWALPCPRTGSALDGAGIRLPPDRPHRQIHSPRLDSIWFTENQVVMPPRMNSP